MAAKPFKPKRVCSFFLEGRCNKGTSCTFAHSQEDLHPEAGAEAWMDSRPQREDWMCLVCADMQFARNEVCRKCGAARPQEHEEIQSLPYSGMAASTGGLFGDDATTICTAHGKKRSMQNLVEDGVGGFRCAPGSECQTGIGGLGGDGAPSRTFTENGKGAPGGKGWKIPQGKGMPGDWICLQCGDHQFARNITCRKCNSPNPNLANPGGNGCNGQKGQGPIVLPGTGIAALGGAGITAPGNQDFQSMLSAGSFGMMAAANPAAIAAEFNGLMAGGTNGMMAAGTQDFFGASASPTGVAPSGGDPAALNAMQQQQQSLAAADWMQSLLSRANTLYAGQGVNPVQNRPGPY